MSSRRGFGLVLLLVLIVAPLSVFALSAVLEEDPSTSLVVSVDGLTWSTGLDESLLASAQQWEPGQELSAVIYVRNRSAESVAADLVVTSTSPDPLVAQGYLTVATRLGDGDLVIAGEGATGASVALGPVEAESTVPVTVSATLSAGAPTDTALDPDELVFRLRFAGQRLTQGSALGPLDASGARLWLAPVFAVIAAGVALLVKRRREEVKATVTDATGPMP